MRQKPDPEFYPVYKSISGYIKLARLDRDMNQEELAYKSGLNPSTIESLEAPSKDKTCTLDTLLRVSRALEVDIGDISEILTYKTPAKKSKSDNTLSEDGNKEA